jgi:hypothetical protein
VLARPKFFSGPKPVVVYSRYAKALKEVSRPIKSAQRVLNEIIAKHDPKAARKQDKAESAKKPKPRGHSSMAVTDRL